MANNADDTNHQSQLPPVTRDQRHTRDHPCPVCGGSDDDQRHRGLRCYGYTSPDGCYAFCTREQFSGSLQRGQNNAYRHTLTGPCGCGEEHGDSSDITPQSPRQDSKPWLFRYKDLPDAFDGYKLTTIYPYHTADGDVAYEVRRFDRASDGEKKYRFVTPQAGRWIEKLAVERVLFRLPALLKSVGVPIIMTEGEKCAMAARGALSAAQLNWPVTTTSGGAKSSHLTSLEPLKGRWVAILPDNNLAGKYYARQVTQQALAAGAALVVVVELEGLPPGGDVVDWLADGHDGAELARLIETALTEVPETQHDSDAASDAEVADRKQSASSQLLALALADDGADLWHDAEGEAWVTYPVKERDGVVAHHETCRIGERAFRRWLAARMYAIAHKQPGNQTFTDALLTMEGIAINERPKRVVGTRLAGDPQEDGVVYLDLADDGWHVVRVDARGWRILSPDEAAALPVRFRRPRGMMSLPIPTRDGSLAMLRQFANVRDDADWRLIIAWLLAALRPTGPYPVLSLAGEQGSAKTTLARLLRALVDPNRAPMRRAPRDERDLMITATNSWTMAFDNLSSLPTWLSDAFCVLSTGGGFATRALYENSAETIFTAQRPIILTGIEEVVTRGDLIDRALLITLRAISDEQRMTEVKLWRWFETVRPGILGALLDAVVGALVALPTVHLEEHPRMADFAEWAVAAESALGWTPGTFLTAYNRNRTGANDIALDASPVAEAVLALLEGTASSPHGSWEGSPGALLTALTEHVGERIAQSPTWPKSPRGLSGALTRVAPNLRRAGVAIEHYRAGDTRHSRMMRLIRSGPCDPSATRCSDDEGLAFASACGQPSEPSEPSAMDDTQPVIPEEMGDESRIDHRTVLGHHTDDSDNRPIDRPIMRFRPHVAVTGSSDGSDGSDGYARPPTHTHWTPDSRDCPVTGGAHESARERTHDGWLRCIHCKAISNQRA